MISFIRGIVAWKEETAITIEVSGIGFKVFVPLRDIEKIRVGEEAFLHTYFSVREDSMELFGFVDKEDLSMFERLLSVSGVGPKAAINLLSAFSSSELGAAILLSDDKKIAKAQGIGAKTAMRIILELKDKISDDALTGGFTDEDVPVNREVENEAISALVALGYSKAEASSAVKKSGTKETVEETVKGALVSLMRF